MNPSIGAREARLRRRVSRDGHLLRRISPRSAGSAAAGPYCIVDPMTNTLLAWQCELESLEEQYR